MNWSVVWEAEIISLYNFGATSNFCYNNIHFLCALVGKKKPVSASEYL
jgi:hypothetical protein